MNIVDDRRGCRPAGTERWLKDGFLNAERMLPLSIVERQGAAVSNARSYHPDLGRQDDALWSGVPFEVGLKGRTHLLALYF